MRGVLSRVAWSERPDWEWWQLHAIMALVEARQGRVGLAKSWVDRAALPSVFAPAVQAAVELASGQADRARRLTDQVLPLAELTGRWRQIPVAVKLACGPERPGAWLERDLLLDSEDWSQLLGSVVLFPQKALEMIVPLLGAEAAALPGLHVDAPEPARPDVKLTPRQLDILKELATPKTMAQIADAMFLGHETVRSTAKALYRRMGVGEREAAVQLGRALGLI